MVALGQPRLHHRAGGGGMVIVKPVKRHLPCIKHRKTGLRCAVVGRHADDTGVDPHPPRCLPLKSHPAMPCDDPVHRTDAVLYRLPFRVKHGLGRDGPDEAGDIMVPPVDHGIALSGVVKAEDIRHLPHPVPLRLGDLRAGVAVPADRQQITGAAILEPAAAVHRTCGKLLFTIPRHHRDATVLHPAADGMGIGAIGHDVAGANHPVRPHP